MPTCARCSVARENLSQGICDACLLEETLAPAGGAGQEQFGPYEVLCEIGEGGLGVVYLAQQSQPIRREVAVKALKTEAGGRDNLARFERERQTLAMLDHPGIAHVFDAGTSSMGRPFLVMEYVDGLPITQFCEEGKLAIRERAALLADVCDAVEYAHRHGVVHRDLKPSNILVANGDRGPAPKVIDFGIAKLLDGAFAASALRTAAGELLGTLEYMSPERASGLDKDSAPAADVYSLGVVLYELLCGALPFDSARLREAGVVAAIRMLTEQEPPSLVARLRTASDGAQLAQARQMSLSALERELAGDLSAIVRKAMMKAPQERYPSAAAFAADLRRYLNAEPILAGGPGVWYRVRKRARKHWLGLAAAVVLLALATLPWFVRVPHATPPSPKLTLLTSYPGHEVQPALSPDGKRLAFAWDGETANYGIYVQTIGAPNPIRLTTDAAFYQHPSWSPDGRSIAFLRSTETAGQVIIAPAGGGEDRQVATISLNEGVWGTLERSPGPAWSPDGKSLAVGDREGASGPMSIHLITLADGHQRRLTSPGNDTMGDSLPAFSPDGRMLAFVRAASRPSLADVFVVPVNGGEERRITFDQKALLGLTWISNGELLAASNRTGPTMLWKLLVRGGTPEAIPIAARGVRDLSFGGNPARLVLVEFFTKTNLWRLNLKQLGARPERLAATTRRNGSPKYSPDGKSIVFVSDRSGYDNLWVADADGASPRRITSFSGEAVGTPRWSPDGQQIVFDGVRDGHSEIFLMGATGGTVRRFTEGTWNDMMPSWSRDGRYIYFSSKRDGDRLTVWKKPANGGPAIRITHTASGDALESADGRLVYISNGANGIWQVSPEGADEHLVPGLENIQNSRYFDVTARGAYFLQDATAPGTIVFYDFATRRSTPLVNLEDRFLRGVPSLSAAADDGWLVYGEVDESGSDILMLENFH